MITIKNDSKSYSLPTDIQGKSMRVLTREGECSLELGSTVSVDERNRLKTGSYVISGPHAFEDLAQRLAGVGITLEQDDPLSRVESLEDALWDLVLNVTGLGPESREYEREGDLVFHRFLGSRKGNPYSWQEAQHLANMFIKKAQEWADHELKSETRELFASPYQLMQIWSRVHQDGCNVYRRALGDRIDLEYSGGGGFGSGGGWSSEVKLGNYSAIEKEYTSNQFGYSGVEEAVFDQGPCILYRAAGDDIGRNGGRTFYRYVVIAE